MPIIFHCRADCCWPHAAKLQVNEPQASTVIVVLRVRTDPSALDVI